MKQHESKGKRSFLSGAVRVFLMGVMILCLTGCRSTVRYAYSTYVPNPARFQDAESAKKVIQRAILEQPIGSAPTSAAVDDESVRFTGSQFAFMTGTRHQRGYTVYYDRLERMDVYRHRRTDKWMCALIVRGEIQARIFTYTQADVERFADAMAFMRERVKKGSK